MKFIVLIVLIAIGLSCPDNCNDCDPLAKICLACAEGFQLNILNTCVDSNTVASCSLYGPSNQCFSCRATFSYSNGQCVKDYSACLAYDPSDDTKCITCGFGTVLRNGVCVGAINCNSNTSSTCTACVLGFNLRNGNCIDNTGNCKTVGSNGVCVTCNTGFRLVGYTCIASNMTVYGCYIFDSLGFCQLCKSGYNLYQGNCLIPSQIQQIQQGLIQLSTVLTQRSTVSVITTTTTTTTTTSAAPTIPVSTSDFGSGFGSETSFGNFDNGGFGFQDHTNTVVIANCDSYDPFTGLCLTCASGYYLSTDQCIQVSVLCNTYNSKTGACQSCKFNIVLFNSQCIDPNCITQQVGGCTECKPLFTISNGFCRNSDVNCLNVNPSTQTCSQCNNGFQLANGVCSRRNTVTTTTTSTTTSSSSITIPFCSSQQGASCSQCVPGYQLTNNQCIVIVVLPANCQTQDPSRPGSCLTCNSGFTNNNGACVQTQSPSTPFCQSYNLLTGRCVACFDQYILSGAICIPNPTTSTSSSNSYGSSSGGSSSGNRDPNCARYNGTACAVCSNRYYFGPNTLCIPVNPLCDRYHSNGSCSSCYNGYSINAGNCIVSLRQTDPNCKSFDAGGACVSCYSGFYLSQTRLVCVSLSPLCKTHNLTNGFCTSCFPGYSINPTGNCVLAFSDPNCQKFDQNLKNCIQCASKFFLDSAFKCRQINPLCKTASQSNGACLSCFQGYILSGDVCIVGGALNSDVNCQTIANGVCQQCYSGYFVNVQGRCAQNNPLCRTSDRNGGCLSCFPGYRLADKSCTLTTSSTSSGDVNCKSTDQSGVCTSCYSGFFLTQGMVCQKMDTLCKTYTASFSACASCYDGYSLSAGQCLLSTQATSLNNDPYCIRILGANCLNCSSGYYLPQNGVCSPLNPICKDSDMSTGACLSCYPGYSLSGITCIITPPIQIAFCNQIVGFSCVSCMDRYYVSNGGCSLVSQLCDGYDMSNGFCLSCIPGYVFQQNQCIFPSLGVDPQCAYYVNSYCTRCFTGFAVVNYVCAPIDNHCTQYDPATNNCRACSQGKIPQGPSCIDL